MPYGTDTGISNNLVDYADLIDQSAISETMASECRTAADGIIDSRLAAVVPPALLPLEPPPALVDNISDDLSTYFLLRRLFTGKDPNDSEWVDKFYTRPLELLDKLVEDPQVIEEAAGIDPEANNVYSNTGGRDRVFSVSRTWGGAGADGGTMDKW